MQVTKLICLGDSITWGFPFGPEYSWVGIAAGALGFPMINRGTNGDTAEDLLFRFQRDVVADRPSHLLTMVGINDACLHVPLELFQDRIMKMQARAVLHGISPLLGLPIPTGDKYLEKLLTEYRLWLTEFAAANDTALVDFSPAMLLPDRRINRECYFDEVHPSEKGYRSMAEAFIQFWKGFSVEKQPRHQP